MWNPIQSLKTSKTTRTEYRFDYFGEGVQWQIVQTQVENDFRFSIVCGHALFLRSFPSGQAKIPELFFRSRDSSLERAERIFFQHMIDSCDIA